ncbi:salivary glue protein Sgs-3-like [Cottoperca gobio]|uniref:Salivary glue protein Sgs-3-like n=1 Tax=Cottoperca gobio TaxID=56716 RepID=A0A6J2RJN0_COTGO|nr:salivary glue protein Sgs-3-like [Cottoperca gobio]
MEVVFDSTTPTAELPNNDLIADTLVNAVNDSNNSFNVSINPASVRVIASTVTAITTTAAPTTAAPTTAAPTTAAPTTAAPTTAAPTIAAPTTAAPTTAAATTAAPTTIALITSRVTFRSVESTFTSDLLNPSSEAFKARATMINEQLTPVFQTTFPSTFKSLEVVSFSNGSVFTTMDLSFVSTNVPNTTQIANTLINAASSVVGFDIEGSSIDVNGISSSGVVSHKISLVTASCLVLLSWLLSSQQ